MSAQSGLQRAIKNMGGSTEDGNNSNRGQKDVIIRKSSSKLLRPSSSTKREAEKNQGGNSGHYRNKSHVVKKNMMNQSKIMQNGDLNSPSNYVGSPHNKDSSYIMYQNQKGTKALMTDSTHAHSQSDAAHGFNSLAQKRLRSQ